MKSRSFTLLALLVANDRLGEPAVHRTMLVKQAFLAETIRPLYRVWLQTFSFVRYYYGPYNGELFARLDTLIFNGLVEVTSTDRKSGRTEARYRASLAGHAVLEKFGDNEIVQLASDLIWSLQSLGIEQATTICKLVYQEAEFARIFSHHDQEGIGAETKVALPSITAAENETFCVLATLQELQSLPGEKHGVATPLHPREVVRLFLQSLALQVHRTEHTKGTAA